MSQFLDRIKERAKAESRFAGITQEEYSKAYIAQKEYSKSADKKKAVDKAVPHLSYNKRKLLYAEFDIAKSSW